VTHRRAYELIIISWAFLNNHQSRNKTYYNENKNPPTIRPASKYKKDTDPQNDMPVGQTPIRLQRAHGMR